MQGRLTDWLSGVNKRLQPPTEELPEAKKKTPEKLFTKTVHEKVAEHGPSEEHLRQSVSEEEIVERTRMLKEIKHEMKYTYLPLQSQRLPNEKIVFHRGSPVANLMIIGEGPGEEEALCGQPFVGNSGKLLDKYLAKNNINREQHIYVTNLVKYRPPGNRDPSYSEIAAELPFLIRQILIVRPKVILCLGRLASTVLSNHMKLECYPDSDSLRCVSLWDIYWNESNLQAMRLPAHRFVCHIYRAYHPSAVLRDKSAPAGERRNYVSSWRQDFLNIVAKLIFPPLRYFDAREELPPDAIPPPVVGKAILGRTPRVVEPGLFEKLEFQLNNIRYDKQANQFHLFGRTANGSSLLVRVSKPSFHFYIANRRILDEDECTPAELQTKKSNLNIDLIESVKQRRKYHSFEKLAAVYTNLEFVHKRSFMHYQPKLSRYVKVTYHETDILKEIVKHLEVYFDNLEYHEKTIPPLTFFHRDRQIWMNGWAVASGESLRRVPDHSRESTCDLEYDVDYDDISGYNPNFGKSIDPKWEAAAPYRVLSVDMEMLGRDGKFPMPEQDAIITICAYANTEGSEKLREMVRKPGTKRDVGPLAILIARCWRPVE